MFLQHQTFAGQTSDTEKQFFMKISILKILDIGNASFPVTI